MKQSARERKSEYERERERNAVSGTTIRLEHQHETVQSQI